MCRFDLGAQFHSQVDIKYLSKHIWLVVWNMFYFPFHIWDVILPIDDGPSTNIFQDG